MAATATVHLAVPRRMLVTLKRCRGNETAVVVDRLPVALPDLSGDEAPVALRHPRPGAGDAVDVRVFGRGFYMAVGGAAGAGAEGMTPDAHAEALLQDLRGRIGRGQDQPPAKRWDLAEPKEIVQGTSRKRGVGGVEGLDIQECHDDGRAAQADLLARAARDWVLVDGRLHQRVEPPTYYMGGHETGGVFVNAMFPHEYEEVPRFEGGPHERFRADRGEDAVGFARAWEEASGCRGIPEVEPWEILRPDLVAEAYGPDDPAEMAAWQARTILSAAAACIGYADDETLQRYAGLRRAGTDPRTIVDGDAVVEGLRGLVATLAAVGEGAPWRARESFKRLADVARLSLLRHDAVDRPRIEREADAAAMGSLAR